MVGRGGGVLGTVLAVVEVVSGAVVVVTGNVVGVLGVAVPGGVGEAAVTANTVLVVPNAPSVAVSS